MKDFWKEYKLSQVAVSLVLAIVVWAFAINELDPLRSNDYGPVPISYIGTEHFAANNLVMISGENTSMRVRVEGNYSAFEGFNIKDISVTADLSDFDEPGSYQITGSKLKVGVHTNGLKIAAYAPKNLSVTLDRIVEREFPVVAQVSGSPANGYRYRTPELGMEHVMVSGPKTILDKIDSVRVNVEANALSESMVYTAPVVFVDENENIIQSEFLTPEAESIDVTIRITKEGEIPLQVDIIPSDTLETDEVSVTVFPEAIAVHADQTILENYPALTLGQIDLSKLELSGTYSFPIKLPDRLSAIGQVPKNAEVRVEVKDQVTKNFTISDFVLNDVAQAPLDAVVETSSVTVTLTGAKKHINELKASDITITLSYDSAALGEGEHELKAKANVNQPGNFAFASDTVPINITLTNSAEEEVNS